MSRNRSRGIWLMVAAVLSFAVQDGFSRHLASTYNPLMVVMVRYWVFAGFVILLALRRPEGLRAAIATRRPFVHAVRAVLLVTEVCVIVWGYTLIGLIESHAVFAICPLLIAGLSVVFLGEKVGWQRWAAIGVGLVGVIVVLRPGAGVFAPAALLPLASALMFAIYSILTRLTTRDEPTFPAFFWPGVVGAVLMTIVGLPYWEQVSGPDWVYLGIYAGIAVLSHWLLLKTYEAVEVSVVQPYAYLQIVFVSLIGVTVFGETLALQVAIGTAIIVGAGLFALWQERPRAVLIGGHKPNAPSVRR